MSMLKVALAGNPNCGKTTLFNALTGSHQRVGNWPGVTVEQKKGICKIQDVSLEVVDIPGTYSLFLSDEGQGIDETIASDYLFSFEADVIVNVVDVMHLERNLYLTTQLRETNLPMIVVLTMVDVAKKRKLAFDVKKLENLLKVPVVAIDSYKELTVLKKQIVVASKQLPKPINVPYTPVIKNALTELSTYFKHESVTPSPMFLALLALESDVKINDDKALLVIDKVKRKLTRTLEEDIDVEIADSRYDFVHHLSKAVLKTEQEEQDKLTLAIDNIVLHRLWGVPIFFFVMYLMFLFSINIGGAFQDFFDEASGALFVKAPAYYFVHMGMPSWLIGLLANGLGKGINTTLTFIPVIAALFFFLSFLEGTGYIARGAFVVDKLMQSLGLPGKAFVPMIVGFGCNVPAVMSARTLGTERGRILTIMMTPFMSCSARLAIFAVFVAAFFPEGGQNVVFALYLLGIIVAVGTGFLLRRTLLIEQDAPLTLELPSYHLPKLNTLMRQTWGRLRHFLFKAGKLIIPVCILIGGLSAITVTGELTRVTSNQSVMALFAKIVTPLFRPMGIQPDNWPATVGLLTGVLAKEVVIASLNTMYSQLAHLHIAREHGFSLLTSLTHALWTIPHNLAHLPEAIVNPVLASSPTDELSHQVYGVMAHHFRSRAAAFSYLVFVLLYVPCVSTMAVIKQELNARWMWFSIIWSTLNAYVLAVVVYQLSTWGLHPLQSLLWCVGTLGVLLIFFAMIKQYGMRALAYGSVLRSG